MTAIDADAAMRQSETLRAKLLNTAISRVLASVVLNTVADPLAGRITLDVLGGALRKSADCYGGTVGQGLNALAGEIGELAQTRTGGPAC
jgi:hypothetical protein